MKDNKIAIILALLFFVASGIAIYSISKNSNLSENLFSLKDETQKMSDSLQKNQEKLTSLEVQKDKLQAVLNKVSPWLDKDYYDSIIGRKIDSENKSLFPPPPAVTPRELDNKLSLLIKALQSKTATDDQASQKTIKRIDELKAPIMTEINKVFESFENLRSDFSSLNNINQQLHKDKEELIVSNNQKVEALNKEIAKLQQESLATVSFTKESSLKEKAELTKTYEQKIETIKNTMSSEANSLKEKLTSENVGLKKEVDVQMRKLQDLIAESNTLAEKSFDSYYQMKKKQFTGIFFSNKQMLEELEREKDNFYSRFNNIKDGSQKIFGIASKETAMQK